MNRQKTEKPTSLNICCSCASQLVTKNPKQGGTSFCCYYDFLISERAIQEDLVINKQDLVKDKLFHLNKPFQLINSGDKI